MTHDRSLDDAALDVLFREGRSYSGWQDKPVSDEQLNTLYHLLKFGPTEANSCPARIKFVQSAAAKERLKPHLDKGNVKKSMTAPVVALIGYDLDFYEHLPKLFPHTDARSWFAGKPDKIYKAAFRSATLQGAYLIMAARSLGLDCGPMSGFDAKGVGQEFFPDQNVEMTFICALGYGDPQSLHPREPRFDFDEVCEIL